MVTTLDQYCSAVLCEKSSLRIGPCNITLKRTLIVPGERDNKNRGLGKLWNAKIPPPQKTWQVCLNNCYTTARKQRRSLSWRSSNGPRNPVLWKKSGWVCSVNCDLMKPKCKWTFWLLLRIVHDFFSQDLTDTVLFQCLKSPFGWSDSQFGMKHFLVEKKEEQNSWLCLTFFKVLSDNNLLVSWNPFNTETKRTYHGVRIILVSVLIGLFEKTPRTRSQRSTIGNKLWLSFHPINFDDEKIVLGQLSCQRMWNVTLTGWESKACTTCV